MNRYPNLPILLLIFTLLLGAIVFSCQGSQRNYGPTVKRSIVFHDFSEYWTVEIDSCEYWEYYNGEGTSIEHKGNCKYCSARTDELVKKVARQVAAEIMHVLNGKEW